MSHFCKMLVGGDFNDLAIRHGEVQSGEEGQTRTWLTYISERTGIGITASCVKEAEDGQRRKMMVT